jgi:selenocysteine-specific elongation factor
MTEALRLTIGTAGHVDHGKTSLVKALTGVDTDRWAEEKRRGMTIDLGFARWDLPSGRQAAVVDVPGHERFLRNMLAGVTGMDLVLLVVAADDGVMPQTREHLDILDLLQVRRGVVVVTKTDLVDPELLELALDDVRQAVAGTFLAEAPLVPVSTMTGAGLDDLVRVVEDLTAHTAPRPVTAPPRMAVDRVFTRPGFGTVVTGTMLAGRWQEGDKVEIWPGDQEARIRGLQVHGAGVAEALAGQRVALNLAGTDRHDLARGTVIGAPGTVRTSSRFVAEVTLLPRHDVPLRHRDRVRVHVGTAEAIGRVVLLDGEAIAPGQTGLVAIELEQPIAVDFDDRFILRRFSPMFTWGGGRVLHPAVERVRRRHPPTLARFAAYAAGDGAAALAAYVAGQSRPVSLEEAGRELPSDRRDALESLITAGRITDLPGIGLVATERLQQWEQAILDAVSGFLAKQTWRRGMPREALLAAVAMAAALADRLIDRLVSQDRLQRSGPLLVRPGHQATWPPAQAGEWQRFTTRLEKDGIIDVADAMRQQPVLAAHLVDHLYDRNALGEILNLGQDIVVTNAHWQELLQTMRAGLSPGFTASQARDVLGLSRRFVIPLLEYCDQHQITRRQGDGRTLIDAFTA